MPVYRIILCKFKQDISEEQKQGFITDAKAVRLTGPADTNLGLLSLEVGPPLDPARAKGFEIAVVLVLESKDFMKPFAENPPQLALRARREAICEDTLAYDLEF